MWCKQFITHIILVSAEGMWHLVALLYHNAHYSQWGLFTNLLLCHIPRNNNAQAHITSGALIRCALYLAAARRTQTTAELVWRFSGRCLLWQLSSQNIFCGRSWSSNQCGGGAILALSSSLNQLPHQKEPGISVYIFSPTWHNSFQLLSTVRSRKLKK